MMLQTLWGIVEEGGIRLLEKTSLPEGSRVIVTLLPDEEESQYWLDVSERSLKEIWDNSEDDIYAQLLEK